MKSTSIVLALALCGCASAPKEASVERNFRTITFHSEPSGARVFMAFGSGVGSLRSQEFLGVTPCTNRVPCREDGTVEARSGITGVSVFVPRVMVLSAELGTNEVKHTFRTGALAQSADRVPASVFFQFPP